MAIIPEGKYVRDDCMQTLIQLVKNQFNTSLNNTIIIRMSKSDYEALHPKSPNTVYYVTDISTGKVECYLGDTKISGEGGGGGGQAVLYDALICDQATDSGIAAVTHLYPQFSCDAGYYFDSKITCTISGRQFTKTNNLPAIGVIIHWLSGGSWTQPLFISPIASAVIYITNYGSTYVYSEPIGSVDYDGITWYYCSLIYAMPGVLNDSEGHLLAYPELVTQQNNKVDPESVLGILQSVHAQKED
jgi:hypothetical protein